MAVKNNLFYRKWTNGNISFISAVLIIDRGVGKKIQHADDNSEIKVRK